MIRFRNSQCRRRFPAGYTAEAVFGTTDVDAINRLSEEEFLRLTGIAVDALPEVVAARAKRESELAERRAEQKAAQDAARAKRESELADRRAAEDAARAARDAERAARDAERDAEVERIRALERPLHQEEQVVMKAHAKAATDAKAHAKEKEQYYAEKEANNGKPPPFKGDESCSFAAPKKQFPEKFEAHLKECESCRNWAYRVSQLQAAPVGAFPKPLSVVKCAAKVQDKQGVKFPGRIDVALFTARRDAAKPKKRRGAKGAAPPAKKPKN